ncbi:GNAT family N-acetyltransferase [Chitinophaga oryzae]|nr:GNAT family N-acetyltransferase [Chitinophaga oryzae]
MHGDRSAPHQITGRMPEEYMVAQYLIGRKNNRKLSSLKNIFDLVNASRIFHTFRAVMIKAAYTDKETVVRILTAAFADNKSVNYVVRQGRGRIARIRALMAYSFELCMLFGRVYLSEDRQACALTLFPDRKKTTLKTILLDLRLALNVIGPGRVRRVMQREVRIKAAYPATPINYLWFIGVLPGRQHRGTGSRLLRQLIAHGQRPVYLETSMIDNVNWYTKRGFEVYQTLKFGHGDLYLLRTSTARA